MPPITQKKEVKYRGEKREETGERRLRGERRQETGERRLRGERSFTSRRERREE
jgi:hypothetical protein